MLASKNLMTFNRVRFAPARGAGVAPWRATGARETKMATAKGDLAANQNKQYLNPGRPGKMGDAREPRQRLCLGNFLASGAVPGLAYLRPGSPLAHRTFWGLVMVLLAMLWCILAENQLKRWLRAPVIVAMAPSPHVITDLPMPAVTICPSTANVDARRFNTTLAAERQLGRRPPLTQREQPFSDLYLLCREAKNVNISETLVDNIEKFAVRNVTEDLTPGSSTDAQATLAAATGLCAAHNSLPGARLFAAHSLHGRRGFLGGGVAGWTPDAGYEGGAEGAYPRRVRGPGEGLRRLLAVRFRGLGSACSHRRRSVQMRFHNPATVATPTQSSVPVVPGEATYLALTPQVVVTSPTLRRWYSPLQRQCYFQDERRLHFFGLYTQSNCEFECLSNVTLRLCGCVPFYYPHDLETTICGDFDSECFSKAQERLGQGGALEACDCLASCTSLAYAIAASKEPLERFFDESGEDISLVQIYFPERYFFAYMRTEVFGFVELVANLGGLLGLCLGMSLVSVAELLFWLVQLVRCNRPARRLFRLDLYRNRATRPNTTCTKYPTGFRK